MLKKLFLSAALVSIVSNAESKQSYLVPVFDEQDRLAQLQQVFPQIDKMYEDFAKKHHFPGYAFGIVVDGKLVHVGRAGYADINKKIPITSQSMFRVASMTKAFTAMAILKLRDEGKLALDDPVYFYIPEMKNQRLTQDSPPITIRNLLTHSTGLPEDNPWGDRQLNTTDADLVALLHQGISWSNATATNFEYSNLGFALLGYIIKKITGMPYQEYIAKNIWQPLHMKQVSWEFATVPAAQLVQGYQWQDLHWQKETLLHDGTFGAMGGMLASVESFSAYVEAQQTAWPPRNDEETGPIKRSSMREMQSPWRFDELNLHHHYLDGHECAMVNAYGYGLHWTQDCEKKIHIGHSGGLPGFGSNWMIMPDYGIGVIAFANLTYAPMNQINLEVLETLVKVAQLKPRHLPPSQILKDRQNALMKLLPSWQGAETSGIFAKNFFLDSSIDVLKKQTTDLFTKAAKIIRIHDVIPENQLRGYFIVEGEKANIKISFTLTPQNPALIQACQITEI